MPATMKRPAAAQTYKRPAAVRGRDLMVKRPAAKSGRADAMPIKGQIRASTLSPSEILPNPKLYQDLSTLERYKYTHAGRSAGGGLSWAMAEF